MPESWRSGYYQVLWGAAFLGWNIKWVPGYQSTGEVRSALERGEVDMTSEAGLNQIQKFQRNPKFRLLVQSGALENGRQIPRREFGDTPLFANVWPNCRSPSLVRASVR